MGLEFYKGNKSLKGNAVFFTIDSKNHAIYIAFKKQTAWSEDNHRPVYKGGKSANIKLEMIEIAGVLNSIDTLKKIELYHDSEKKKTQIFFGPYTRKRDTEGNPIGEPDGLALSVVQTDKKDTEMKDIFTVAFSFVEARLLTEWLKYALTHAFNHLYSEDVARGKEYLSKKAGKEKPVAAEEDALLDEKPAEEDDSDPGF